MRKAVEKVTVAALRGAIAEELPGFEEARATRHGVPSWSLGWEKRHEETGWSIFVGVNATLPYDAPCFTLELACSAPGERPDYGRAPYIPGPDGPDVLEVPVGTGVVLRIGCLVEPYRDIWWNVVTGRTGVHSRLTQPGGKSVSAPHARSCAKRAARLVAQTGLPFLERLVVAAAAERTPTPPKLPDFVTKWFSDRGATKVGAAPGKKTAAKKTRKEP